MSVSAWTAVLVVLVAYFSAQLPLLSPNASNSTSFSTDYYACRRLFRSNVRLSGGELHMLHLELDDFDLSIDIGLFVRSKKKLLIHISGTHGVEGFAGSAIQSALMDSDAVRDGEAPSVMLVHALNPYGFAFVRDYG